MKVTKRIITFSNSCCQVLNSYPNIAFYIFFSRHGSVTYFKGIVRQRLVFCLFFVIFVNF